MIGLDTVFFRAGGVRVGLALLIIGVTAILTDRNAAAQAPTDAAIDAVLAAGEFGPALRLARDIQDVPARDRWLARIAADQAVAGARRAATDSLADIYDDAIRADAARSLASAAAGGAAEVDFDTLLDLIKSTIAPDSWVEVGGPAAADGFPGGVYVDAAGVLRKHVRIDRTGSLDMLRSRAADRDAGHDARRPATLRKISLSRLEREVQLTLAAGEQPDEAMRTLAGLRRIQYVMVYPESRDIVLAGPAGDWRYDDEGRLVAVDTAQPIVQLDDLVVVLRNAFGQEGRFGCSITPKQENLARTRAFLAESAKKPLKPGRRPEWLERLRTTLGQQDIDVYGIDPQSRAAQVLVEADYRMKLVGLGLEDGTLGMTGYLDSIHVEPGHAPPPMSVLRWWFVLNYKAVETTESRNIYHLQGQGAKVLSENEMLTELGKRIHTGKSDQLNSEFAQAFTRHFDALAQKYPVYADLRNIFDLALVAALLRAEDVPSQIDWQMACFLDPQAYRVALGTAPREVPSVINHRVIHKKHIVAGVSGGVTVAPRPLVREDAIRVNTYGMLDATHGTATPSDVPHRQWWWD